MEQPGRARTGNEVIEGEIITLDYGSFIKKSFYKCKLVFKGGLPPTMIDCDFIESTFIFDGPALSTAKFMAALAASSVDGKKLVLNMLGIE